MYFVQSLKSKFIKYLQQLVLNWISICLCNKLIYRFNHRPIDWRWFTNYLATLICPFGLHRCTAQLPHCFGPLFEVKLMKQCFWGSAAYFAASLIVHGPNQSPESRVRSTRYGPWYEVLPAHSGICKQEGTHPFHGPTTAGGYGNGSGWVSSGKGILEFDKCAAWNQNEMQWNIRCTEKISALQKVKKIHLVFVINFC